MDVIYLIVSHDKKMDLLVGDVVEGFREVIEVDFHDVFVANMHLSLYVSKMLKDMKVSTDVDFDDVASPYVAGGMNI